MCILPQVKYIEYLAGSSSNDEKFVQVELVSVELRLRIVGVARSGERAFQCLRQPVE